MALEQTGKLPTPEMLREHSGFVRALARGMLLGPDQADDLVQETALAALRTPPDNPSGLRRWMGVVARNAGLKILRSAGRRARREKIAAQPEALRSTLDAAAELDLHRALVEALQSLSEPYRSTIVMRYFHDLGPTEIAHAIDVPVKTVETRLRRALATLRERLERGQRARARSLSLLSLAAPARTASVTGAHLGGAVAMSLGSKTVLAAGTAALALVVGLGIGGSESQGSRPHDQPDGQGRIAMLEARGPSKRGSEDTHGEETTQRLWQAEHTASRLRSNRTQMPTSRQSAPPPGGSAVGTVRAKEGEPANVQVRLEGWLAAENGIITLGGAPDVEENTSVGRDGEFQFFDLKAGIYKLVAEADGFIPARSRTFSITPDKGRRLQLVLTHGHSLLVQLVDSRGSPVSGRTVLLEPIRGRGRKVIPATVITDANGAARWSLLEAGWYRASPVEDGGWAPRDIRLPVPPSPGPSLQPERIGAPASESSIPTCRVVVDGSISGRVLGPDGQPMAGLKVDLEGLSVSADVERHAELGRSASGKTTDDGRYRVSGLPEGRYTVRLRREGFAAPGGVVVLADGGETEHDIHIGPERVLGSVTLARSDTPCTKATVSMTLLSNPRTSASVYPDSDGAWEISGLAPGEYELAIRHWQSEYERIVRKITVVAGSPIELNSAIRLRAPGRVILRVIGRKRADRVSFSVWSPDGRSTSMGGLKPGEDLAEFTLDRGPQTIVVRRNGVRIGQVEVVVPPGGQVRRSFEIGD